MPRILFPASSAPGKDEVEGSGRLINAYSERLQEGAPAQYVIRRAPGLVEFGSSSAGAYRGMWHDRGLYLYTVMGSSIVRFDEDGTDHEITTSPIAPIGIVYTDTGNDAGTAASYSFASLDLGAPFPTRVIAVAVDSTAAPSGVTIAGVTASLVAKNTTFSGSRKSALYSAIVPTGRSGTVAVTFGASQAGCRVGVFAIRGASSATPDAAVSDISGGVGTDLITTAENSVVIAINAYDGTAGTSPSPATGSDGADFFFGGYFTPDAITIKTTDTGAWASARWTINPAGLGYPTWAKNNKTPVADQVLVIADAEVYTFTATARSVLSDADLPTPNSVCFGEGYFFFTIADGRCFASGLNATTINSNDVTVAESRDDPLVRGVFWNGELYLFGETTTEVWASNGNPNSTGFPLNRSTVIWRGLIGPGAVCGFEEGFEGGLFIVADDNSVRLIQGWQPQTISTPDVERAIEACADKSAIRCFVYDLDGHACVVVDIAGEATWVYDLTEGGKWHERKSDDADAWKLTGNSVKAFGKWIAGDRTSGNLYQIDPSAFDEDGDTLSFVAESIAMEAFPQRLQVPRADFNFGMGVGTDSVEDPKVKIQWSDDGGHTWSDPLTASLGEKGRRKMQVRKNRLGLTGVKGRRFRLTVDDPVYVALLAGSMEVEARR